MATIFSGLASKPMVMFSSGLTSKSVVSFLVQPHNQGGGFSDLSFKITTAISWFVPQNQVSDGLSVAPQNRREDETVWDTHRDIAVCFTWKQVRLGFFSLTLRLAETRRRVVHVAPS
jgi:hypothetical protein